MIYVEEKKFDRQLDLIEFVSLGQEVEIVIWMYPESNLDTLFGYDLIKSSDAEHVTTYEDGTIAKRTPRLKISKEVIDLIRTKKQLLNKNCDSICLYLLGEFNWLGCTVGHEGMGLIKDDRFYETLIENSFNASFNAPSWW